MKSTKIKKFLKKYALAILSLIMVIILAALCYNKYSENEAEKTLLTVPDGCVVKFEQELIHSGDTLWDFASKYLSEHKDTMSDVSINTMMYSICEVNGLDYDTEVKLCSQLKAGEYINIPYIVKYE